LFFILPKDGSFIAKLLRSNIFSFSFLKNSMSLAEGC
jgi:hypothetical protein